MPAHHCTLSQKIANQITSAVANNVGKAVVLQWKTDICRPQPRSMRCFHAMNMIGHTYFAASLATHTRTKQIVTLWHIDHRCFLPNQTKASVAASHIITSTKTIIISHMTCCPWSQRTKMMTRHQTLYRTLSRTLKSVIENIIMILKHVNHDDKSAASFCSVVSSHSLWKQVMR